MCREYTRESRWQKQPSELSEHAHRGDEDACPRSHVSTMRRGSYRRHVYRRCVLSFRHVSHSRGFYADICPTRGCKWVRPTYDRQSRVNNPSRRKVSEKYDLPFIHVLVVFAFMSNNFIKRN